MGAVPSTYPPIYPSSSPKSSALPPSNQTTNCIAVRPHPSPNQPVKPHPGSTRCAAGQAKPPPKGPQSDASPSDSPFREQLRGQTALVPFGNRDAATFGLSPPFAAHHDRHAQRPTESRCQMTGRPPRQESCQWPSTSIPCRVFCTGSGVVCTVRRLSRFPVFELPSFPRTRVCKFPRRQWRK